MNRVTRALTDTATKVLFRTSEITAIADHGARFRSIELTGPALQKATWNVGDKVQVRTDRDGFTVRTYTPISWDVARGTTRLLAYAHGNGPGSNWVRALAVGDPCQFFGPRRSLKLDDLAGPILFVGDETSFAVVAAWRARHPDLPPVAELFEVSEPDESTPALEAVGLSSARLFRRDRGSTHVEQLADTVIDLLRAHPDASPCLTGKAQTIAALRRRIKSADLAARPIRVKAYWDEHRSGLD